MSKTKKENTSKKKELLKKLRGFLAMVMVAVISIVGTLAYLSRKTDPKVNTFTATPDIDVKLTEDEFDEDEAGNYQPGVVYPKNPTLTNNTDGNSKDGEWVVIRVDYLVQDQKTEDGKLANDTTYTPWSYANITNDVDDDNDAKGLIEFNAKVSQSGAYIDADYIKNNPKYTVGYKEGIQALKTNTGSNWIRIEESWLSTEVKNAIAEENAKLTEGVTWESEYYVYKYQLVAGKQDDVANAGQIVYKKDESGKDTEDVDTDNTGSVTTPLFQNVVVKSQEQLIANGYAEAKDTENEDETESVLSKLPGFNIVVVGGAIKNSGDTTVTISTGELNPNNVSNSSTIENNIVNQLVKLLVSENPSLNA